MEAMRQRPSLRHRSRCYVVAGCGWRATHSFKDGCDKTRWRSVSALRVCASASLDPPRPPPARTAPRPALLHVPQHVRPVLPQRGAPIIIPLIKRPDSRGAACSFRCHGLAADSAQIVDDITYVHMCHFADSLITATVSNQWPATNKSHLHNNMYTCSTCIRASIAYRVYKSSLNEIANNAHNKADVSFPPLRLKTLHFWCTQEKSICPL